MHHATARSAIARILAGSGFGVQAIALVHAARLHEDASCPAGLSDAILSRCLALPGDAATPYTHPLNQLAAPGDAAGLCQQLIPAIIAQRGDPSVAIASLEALSALWPHAGADERLLLRTRLLDSLGAARAPDDSVLTTFQLREWQKRIPTHYGVQTPSVASLRGLLDAPDALAAYLLLAEHLGMTVELETLCWVFGSISIQMIQTRHDRAGHLVHAVQGAAACERLVPLLPAESLVTVISQLTHRLWWLHAKGGLHRIRQSIDQSQRPYRQAVLTGDITLAQRAARVAAQDAQQFWTETWRLVDSVGLSRPTDLPRLLALLDCARWRADDGAVVADDAAAIAATLTDLAYQSSPAH